MGIWFLLKGNVLPNTVLPISVYPSALDTDENLFAVYNTSESVLTATLNAWQTTISIFPVALGKPEIWASSGYITIEGELIYYSSVSLDVNGKVNQFLNCIRRVNGTPSQNYSAGTDVRGFVIAEHHNNLVRALVNIENFVGTVDTTDQETINWKLQYINSLNPLTDDAGCPQIEFYYVITNSNPITGTTIAYNLNIIGNYTSFTISFGDGNTESGTTSGTYSYPPNKQVDPVVTVTSTDCDTLQTSAERVTINDLQGITTPTTNLPIIIPPIPDFPNFDLAVVNPVANNIQFPPIVMPCLDIGPFGPIVVPSTISIINPYPIPSVITFTDVPVFPSVITINNNGAIPSSISIINTLPSSINVNSNIPSSINVNSNIPSNITISPSSISLIGPSAISVIGIPSTIQVGNIDINLALNSDYCTVCTNQVSVSAPQTGGGTTDVGCQVCPGANQKISKVTVTIHDFFVQSFTTNQFSRYDLVKLLVVGPDGNNCLLMGGATAGSTATPQFIMNEPVTLTFDDASSNNIYDFSVPLKTQTYAPNANGNTQSRNAGQVTLNTPAPAPGGFNGYGSSLAVFADTDLKSGQWKVYMAVGPTAATFTNLAYFGSTCVRVSSTLDDACPTTPGPTPSGQTMRPTDPPTATPRRSNPPTPPPATPAPTQRPTATPMGSQQIGPDPGPPIPIPPFPPRPPRPPQPTPPPPTRAPRPSSPPTPTPNCGNCTYVVKMEDCGAGICTYYWNNASSSWSRCAECQNCNAAGGNCSCPEARWMVSFGILPQDGSGSPAVNTNCQEFIWSVEGGLTSCNTGFCAYEYFAPVECQQDANSCFYFFSNGKWVKDSERNECYSEGCECLDPFYIEYFFNGFPPNPVPNQRASFNCYRIPKDEDGYEMLDWRLQPGSNCQGATGGCECLTAGLAQFNGLLPKRGTPGGAKEVLPCYKKSAGSSNCKPGQCECPPAPTLQAIQSSTQTISLPCGAVCGECWSAWEPDLANPCDPLTTDTTCLYTFSMAGGWELDLASSSCGCENMRCLTVDEALEYGLLPEVGDTKNLSCYFIGWNQLGGCNPEADPPCECPPEPTNPPDGEEPSVFFVVDACARPTPTPTPTAGCGFCYYEFNAPTCGNGGCTYTYKADLDSWVVLNECTGTGNCDCLPADYATLAELLPEDPLDDEQISLSCYSYNSAGLEGEYVYTANDCTALCECQSEKPTVPGYWPGQVYAVDCVLRRSTPTPTPQPSIDCGNCEWVWDPTLNQGDWYQTGFCTNQGLCYCEKPNFSGGSAGELAYTGCFPDPTATPTASATPQPTPTPSACGITPTITPTASANADCATGCKYQCVGGTWSKVSDSCNSVCPSCPTCISITGPCSSDKELIVDCCAQPGTCVGECWFTWNGSGWDLDNLKSNCLTYENPSLILRAATCACSSPQEPGTSVGQQRQGFCGPVPALSNYDLDWNSAEFSPNPVTTKTNSAQTLAPVPTKEASVTKVSISRDKVKLCRHAGKQPLEMIKQNCGACAIRTCDKLGLCSHTAVIDGRDDVYCCQLCDYYEPSVSIDAKATTTKPASIEIYQTNLAPVTSIISPLAAVAPVSNPVPMIGDAISMADEQIKSNNQIKLVLSDSAIKVDINDLFDGNSKKNENK